ncbi:MAG: hypothetical protein H0U52_03975 [Chloroflexi bacterium]|nr:hypothetical protein [Chloroflexota bacterium]
MNTTQRVRNRNTAYGQVGVAIACLVVAVLLLYVDTLPGTLTELPGALVTLGLVAIWMFRRGWGGFRAIAVRPAGKTTNEGAA